MAAPNLIIGLGHRKRVGKDTFAGYLEEVLEQCGYRAHRLAFALPMKESAANLFGAFGLRDAAFYEAHPEMREVILPRLGKTPRQLWIEYGNAVRTFWPDAWVELLNEQIEDIRYGFNEKERPRPLAFIITDVRFPNEAEAIKSWGGTLMEIRRNSAPTADDPAERALRDYMGWNWSIANEGSLDDLRTTAGRVADYVIGDRQKGI